MKLKNQGFTLIELVVVIAIIASLSGIILFSVTQYISKGKDSNISGNLAVLIPAGEVFYNGNGYSYNDGLASFCDLDTGRVLDSVLSQMPGNVLGPCYDSSTNKAGVCCKADPQAWAACAKKFTDPNTAFCVDSRGMKKDIPINFCNNSIFECP